MTKDVDKRKTTDNSSAPYAQAAYPQAYGLPTASNVAQTNYATTAPFVPQQVPVDAYGRPIVTATRMPPQTQVLMNNANIVRDAQGNALCKKCSAPYPLPSGCTSWRCRNCHNFNDASIYGDGWCLVL